MAHQPPASWIEVSSGKPANGSGGEKKKKGSRRPQGCQLVRLCGAAFNVFFSAVSPFCRFAGARQEIAKICPKNGSFWADFGHSARNSGISTKPIHNLHLGFQKKRENERGMLNFWVPRQNKSCPHVVVFFLAKRFCSGFAILRGAWQHSFFLWLTKK